MTTTLQEKDTGLKESRTRFADAQGRTDAVRGRRWCHSARIHHSALIVIAKVLRCVANDHFPMVDSVESRSAEP